MRTSRRRPKEANNDDVSCGFEVKKPKMRNGKTSKRQAADWRLSLVRLEIFVSFVPSLNRVFVIET